MSSVRVSTNDNVRPNGGQPLHEDGRQRGNPMVTRRTFLKMSAAAGGAIALRPGVFARPAWADPPPGGTLDPDDIDRFVRDLVIPPVMPRSGVKTVKGGKNVDWYDIAVRQFRQEIVPGL